MLRNTPILPNVMPVVAWFVILVSCAVPAGQEERPPYGSQLMAEHSMMKKRLPLIERENDVLKEENLQQKKQILELVAGVKDLDQKLTSLGEKYTNEIALSEEHIQSLKDTIQERDRVSAEKIQELLFLNQKLEKKMAQTVSSLNQQIAEQKKTFEQEREQIRQKSAEKENLLSGRLNEMKETLKARESEIASLKATVNEQAAKFEEMTALAEKLKEAKNKAEAELDSVKAVNTELSGKLKAVSNEAPAQGGRPKSQ